MFREGRRFSNPLATVYVAPSLGATRVGIAVARRVGSAVRRNRARRRVREVVRRRVARFVAGWAVVVVAKEGAVRAPFAELERGLASLWRRAGVERGTE